MKTLQITLLFLIILLSHSQSALQILQFSPYDSPTDKQIKDRFRELSKKYHPDRNPDQSTTQKYRQIVEAYESLMKGSDDEYQGNHYGDGHFYYSNMNFNGEDFRKMQEEFFTFFENQFGTHQQRTIYVNDVFWELGLQMLFGFIQIALYMFLWCFCMCLACKECRSCCSIFE